MLHHSTRRCGLPRAVAAALRHLGRALGLGLIAGPFSLLAGASLCAQGPTVETVGLATRTRLGHYEIGIGGTPRIGEPFHVELAGATPGSVGAVFFSPVESPVSLPAYGATLYPGLPLFTEVFVVDDRGRSPRLIDTPVVPADYDQLFVSMQGAVLDPLAQGGIAASKGGRVVFGENVGADPLPLRLHPSGAVGGFGDPVLADFDQDGDMDLAFGALSAITLLPGLPGGGFEDFRVAASGSLGYRLAGGDLNGDGILDLVYDVPLVSSLGAALGDGSGSFAPVGTVPSGPGFIDLKLGDLDGDGNLDALVSSVTQSGFMVHLGNGDGTFQSALTNQLPSSAQEIQVADLNGDGTLDALLRFVTSYQVYLGVGNGSFTTLSTQSVGTGFTALVEDIDGNGTPDLALTSDQGVELLELFRGAGDGTFVPLASYPLQSRISTHLAYADVDLDGFPDFLVNDLEYSGVEILYGTNTGSFGSAQRIYAGVGTEAFFVLDQNNDGLPDVVSEGRPAGGVCVMEGLGSREFLASNVTFTSTSTRLFGLGDVDGDQVVDAISPSGEGLSVFRGRGDGSFYSPLLRPVSGTGPIGYVAVNDFDEDGGNDLLMSYLDGLHVRRGSSALDFLPREQISARYCGSVVAADVNRDGHLDAIAATLDGTVPGTGNGIVVHFGVGDGSFGGEMLYPAGAALFGLRAARLDGDAFEDLVAIDFTADAVLTLRNLGDGTYAPVVGAPLPAGSGPLYLATGDLDGDGFDDVAVAMQGTPTPTLAVLLGVGDGTMGPPAIYDVDVPSGVEIVDADGDRIPDVVVATRVGPAVYYGAGDGTFPLVESFGLTNSNPSDFHCADLDGDLLPDFALLSPASGLRLTTLSTLTNRLLRR